MCARYLVYSDDEIKEMNEIMRQIDMMFGAQAAKTREIYPSDTAPVLMMTGVTASLFPVTWGFPKWDGKGIIINARSETAHEKATFRKPLLTRRCVVPSIGFYEWQHVDGKKKKDKYLFRRPGENVLYMAGIVNTFRDRGMEYDAFVILTANAVGSVSSVHDRMPVILASGELEAWLTDDAFMHEVLHRPGPELERLAV